MKYGLYLISLVFYFMTGAILNAAAFALANSAYIDFGIISLLMLGLLAGAEHMWNFAESK